MTVCMQGVFPLTFIVKPIDPIDASALVVSTKHKEIFGVLNFVSQQQATALEPLLSSIDVVTDWK